MHDKGATAAALALLILSLLTSSPSSVQAATLTAGPAPVSPVQAGYIYIIRPDDTLWDIAVAHDITLQVLLDANHLSDPAALRVGQMIRVPASQPAPTPEPQAQMAPPPVDDQSSPTPAPAADATVDLAAPSPEAAAEPAAPAAETPAEPAVPVAEQPAEPAPSPQESFVAIAPELADWPAAVLSILNAHRAENGLPALAWSDKLAQAAQAHAGDIARRNRGSHIGSDGARLRERLSRVGYEASYATENWANARSAEHAVRMWWNESASGPHRRAILGQNYTEIGIGVARGAWGYYLIADFASR